MREKQREKQRKKMNITIFFDETEDAMSPKV